MNKAKNDQSQNSKRDRTTTASSKKETKNNKEKTKAELLETAKRSGVTGRHAMTKDQLIKAIGKKID